MVQILNQKEFLSYISGFQDKPIAAHFSYAAWIKHCPTGTRKTPNRGLNPSSMNCLFVLQEVQDKGLQVELTLSGSVNILSG